MKRSKVLWGVVASVVLVMCFSGWAFAQGLGNQQCLFFGVNGAIVLGDPGAYYATVGGNLDGRLLAYKIEGEFPHCATYTWCGYDSYGFLHGYDNILDDRNIKPDKGSVNPFIPGTDVFAKHRNYTMWGWPRSVPVPQKMKNENIFFYEDIPTDPTDTRGRFLLEMRMYKMFTGYRPLRELPSISVYDITNGTQGQALKKPVSCVGLGAGGGMITSARMYTSAVAEFGSDPVPQPADPTRIAFIRPPYQFYSLPEGYNPDQGLNYLAAQSDPSNLSVITVHKTPTHLNINELTLDSIFGVPVDGGYEEYEGRYQSVLLQAQLPIRDEDQIDNSDAIFQPDGSWVTVVLPQDPVLSEEEAALVRAKAAELGHNVIGGAPLQPNLGIPPGLITYRNKMPGDFEGAVTNIPSWTDPNDPHDLYEWTNQTSDEFFDKYSSTPENMGPYWIDGVNEEVADYLAR